MQQGLERFLHRGPGHTYLLEVAALLLAAVVLGAILRRFLLKYAEKFRNHWQGLVFSLLASLPVPLLIWLALYAALEVLHLPPRLEHIGSRLIAGLMVVVVYFLPTTAIILFFRDLGRRKPNLEHFGHFIAFAARSVFGLATAYTLLTILKLPQRYNQLGTKIITATAIILIFHTLAKLVVLYLQRLAHRDPSLQRVTEPASFVTRLLFGLLAVIVVFENAGIHLTALWTTLGVGSVAVALALQETLSNLFSGLYLLADRPLSPGDYIKLDSGYEGYVLRVGWRSTSIRTLGNNLIVVPNATLAKAVLINYSKPEERMSFGIQVSVPYGTDPRLVERVLLEVAKEAAHDSGGGLLQYPEPSVSLIPGFGQSTLDFTLGVQVRRFVDQYQVQSDLRKRILDRFEKEGIGLPYPTQRFVLEDSISAPFPKRELNSRS